MTALPMKKESVSMHVSPGIPRSNKENNGLHWKMATKRTVESQQMTTAATAKSRFENCGPL